MCNWSAYQSGLIYFVKEKKMDNNFTKIYILRDHMKKEDEEVMFGLQELILNEEGITR